MSPVGVGGPALEAETQFALYLAGVGRVRQVDGLLVDFPCPRQTHLSKTRGDVSKGFISAGSPFQSLVHSLQFYLCICMWWLHGMVGLRQRFWRRCPNCSLFFLIRLWACRAARVCGSRSFRGFCLEQAKVPLADEACRLLSPS